MSLTKKASDSCQKAFSKLFFGSKFVPRGLFELSNYFRTYGPIEFKFFKEGEDTIVAVSQNYRFGSIVTSGKDIKDLDRNIKDAILTSFEVPSSYAKEAKIYRKDEKREVYALA